MAKANSELESLYDVDAEDRLLGSVMLDTNAMDDVAGVVAVSDFWDHANAVIWRHMLEMHGTRKGADVVLLRARLIDAKELDAIGGTAKLTKLFGSVAIASNVGYYADRVADLALKRRVLAASQAGISDVVNRDATGKEILGACEARLSALADGACQANAITTTQLCKQAISAIEARMLPGGSSGVVSTGLCDLNTMLGGGAANGNLLILAGRPSMGKTALAINIATNAAKDGVNVLVFSLEMTAGELADRILASELRIELAKLRSGNLSQAEKSKIMRACSDVSQLPLRVFDDVALTTLEIAARVRKEKRKAGCDLVIVDYLQLIEADDHRVPREQQVARMSKALKGLAKEMKLPVICLAQMNRKSEDRVGNRPKLSDLRESGAIEQDADVVMFVHRDSYYCTKTDTTNVDYGEALVIVAKSRNGPTGDVDLIWDRNTTTFRNKAEAHREKAFDAFNGSREPEGIF